MLSRVQTNAVAITVHCIHAKGRAMWLTRTRIRSSNSNTSTRNVHEADGDIEYSYRVVHYYHLNVQLTNNQRSTTYDERSQYIMHETRTRLPKTYLQEVSDASTDW